MTDHMHDAAQPEQQTPGAAVLKHADELHDLGFNAGWNGAIEESAKLVENFDCHLAGYPNDEAQQYYESGVADACNMLEERIRALAAQPPAAPVGIPGHCSSYPKCTGGCGPGCTYEIVNKPPPHLSAETEHVPMRGPDCACCEQQPRKDCEVPGCGCDPAANKVLEAIDEAGFEITKKPEPTPWDANHNRSYEPVETLAKEIYDGFVYDGPAGTKKPHWTPGGNGMKQDEARFEARRRLREAGHTSAVSRPDRSSKVCGYSDGCPPDGPVCHLCEHLQPRPTPSVSDASTPDRSRNG